MPETVDHLDHIDRIIGEGHQGIVFECSKVSRENKPVAIKRIQLINVNSNENGEEALRQLCHPNVIKLIDAVSDKHFRYYYLELCSASLDKLFLNEGNPKKYCGLMPPAEDVLHQLAMGLEYIHNAGLIHRDLKPENVLIWENPANNNPQVLMKWADFGLSKRVNERGSHSISGVKGTYDWIAPELLQLLDDGDEIHHQFENEARKRGTIKSDVFSEGLVFGYYFLNGIHLFGSRFKIQPNIISNQPVHLPNIQMQYARELIAQMIADEPENRITSSQIVQYLEQVMKNGPKIKSNPTGKTATELQNELFNLCRADAYPKLEEIEKLIEKGVDINRQDQKGWTALLLLTQWKEDGGDHLIDLIRCFITHGANLNYRDELGMNVLHLLCGSYQKENLIDLIRLLIDNQIQVDCTDNDGSTALHLLCNNYPNKNIINLIQLLIENGIEVNCKNNFGWNAIHFLCRNYGKENLIDSIRLLIDRGIQLNCQNNDGSTALHLLCNNYQHENLIELIRLLIQNGIKVNCQDNINRNALHILCRNYRKGNLIEIIRLFIENGCDVTKETRSNVMISNRNVEEFQEVIQLLEQHAR